MNITGDFLSYQLFNHLRMPKYILSLDAGTTSSRAIIFDQKAKIKSISQIEFPQIFPKPGWVEHNPEDIWESQLKATKECIKKAGIKSEDLAAIGITNQRETAILWDRKSGKPVYNAIVWQDRRTSGICDNLKKEGWETVVKDKTGLVIDAYFSATKIKWILESDEKLMKRAEDGDILFGTVDTWLIWKMTNGKKHITDVTNASRTMLYDIRERKWDKHLLELLNIPEEILPEVKSSSDLYGVTEKEIFGSEIPISGILGDQQAALFGQLCLQKGMVKNTYGTGCFIVMNTGEKFVKSENGLLTTLAWEIDGKVNYALEGSVFIAGAVVQWLRDQLHIIKDSSEVEKLAGKVDDNGDVYFVPAFTGLGAPHWDQYARGALFGLTRGSNDSHIARAALESIAYQTYDVIQTMQQDVGHDILELRVDGGACSNNLLMQFQSELLQSEVIRPRNIETTAMGAAFAAGLAVQFWKDIHALKELWGVDKKFSPEFDFTEVKQKIHKWHKAVNRAKDWEETI